ncbi:MAG: SDR family oxidoreductase [Bacteroidetes Order II. Incertae sedis bacterium]|nr:SDR family oxidoreductase [Bacteroidetes Order II. bacterium]
MNTFKDKVVVLTGASSGIGKALALQLADQGAKLVLAARDLTKLQETEALCIKKGVQTHVVSLDVSIREACSALIRETIEAFGQLDVLINNAGVTMWARFDEITEPEALPRLMEVNFWGSVWCTYYALPHLKQSKGRVVGVASLTGKTGVPTRSIYAATKHAMTGFFDSLRIELAGSGVDITMIYPGFVQSEIRGRAIGPDGKAIGDSPVKEREVMTAEACARQILVATAARKRELVMTTRGKLGLWVKLIAPRLVDNIARKAIETGK